MGAEPPIRRRHRIVSIVGTRPEAIKMAPVARALAARARVFEQRVVLTGQHRDLAPFFADLEPGTVRELDFDPRNLTPPKLRERLHALLCKHLDDSRPDLLLVHGDTTSAIAASFAARDCRIALGHVEAGLRSFDYKQPWPEEGNRIVIDAMSDLLFAPTEAAARNLERDWRVAGRVFVTGNSGIDQLFHTRDLVRRASRECRPPERRIVLVTCHRKENQGAPTASVCGALKRLVRTLPIEVVLPLHPNRHVRRPIERALAGEPSVRLVEPLDYPEMVALMDRCWLILTDSGGLQEEGAALGRPVLVLRNVTERPEALESFNLELVGTDEQRIVDTIAALFEEPERYARMSRPSLAFGDGRAAERVVSAIEASLSPHPVTRLSRSTNRPRAASTSA